MIPILHMKKLRHKEIKILLIDIAGRWQVFLNCPVNTDGYSADEIREAGLLPLSDENCW